MCVIQCSVQNFKWKATQLDCSAQSDTVLPMSQGSRRRGMAGYSNEGAQFTQLGKMMGRLVRDNYGSRSQGFPTMRVTGQCSPKTFLHGRTQVPFRRITGSAALALAAIGNCQSQLASDVETVRKSEGWFSPQELYRVVKPTHIERPYRTCTPPGCPRFPVFHFQESAIFEGLLWAS